MRAIVFTSLMLSLISLAGCQSNKVAYQVESQIGPPLDGHPDQYLVKIKVFQVSLSGSRFLVGSPTQYVRQGNEGKMSVEHPNGIRIDWNVLIDQGKSFTTVSLSKKGRVFWSSDQTTEINSKG